MLSDNSLYSPSIGTTTFAPGGKYYLYLFLIWPFLAFLSAVTSFHRKESQIIVYLFVIYYGLSYVVYFEGQSDSVRYAEGLTAVAALPFSEIFRVVSGYYSGETSMDFIEPLISFLVSRFTTDHKLLFGAYAALFGFFYLKSIAFAYSLYRKNQGLESLIHLLFFVLVLPVTAINGFRMWTAAWVFLYGAYHVILYRDPRYFLITFGAALVHWSFLTVNGLLLVYFFAGNRNMIYLPLAAASFVVPTLLSTLFQRLALIMGGGLRGRYDMYSNEAYVMVVKEQSGGDAWFMRVGYDLIFFYILLSMFFIHYKFRKKINLKAEENMFSFLLLMLAFVNFGKEIPSFGVRFQIIFFLFGTLYLILCYSKLNSQGVGWLTIIGLFPMLLLTAIVFRQGADSINAWLFTPGFGLPWLMSDLSLSDILFN